MPFAIGQRLMKSAFLMHHRRGDGVCHRIVLMARSGGNENLIAGRTTKGQAVTILIDGNDASLTWFQVFVVIGRWYYGYHRN